ncbi:hypothetical protein Ndes2526B_g00587 [Nannochloris sp. 'desiccata']
MARLDTPLDSPVRAGKPPMARLVILTIFILSLIFTASYMFYTPLLQIYWGTTGRMTSVIAKGKSERTGIDPNEGFDLTKINKPKDSAPIGQPAVVKEEEEEAENALKEPATTSEIKSDETNPSSSTTTSVPAAGTTAVRRREDDPDYKEDGSARYALTKEMAIAAATDSMGTRGAVVVTWANYHYKDFVMNWVDHLKETGCNTFLVGAMDDELLKHLQDAEVPTFSMSSGLTLGDFGWGSSTFNKMGREKISLIQTFTKWGVEVIISDVDTVWLQNPIPYMAKYSEADVLTSSDHLKASFPGDSGLEDPSTADSAANIGIMLFRPSAAELADEWVKVLDSDDKLWDQNVFNDLMHRGEIRNHQFNSTDNRPDRLFIGYDGKLKFGILPVSMFCSGHTYFTQRMPDTVFVDPYVVHATFQFSGTAGKRHRFRERLLWNDEPHYFKHDNGFISANNYIPDELLNDVETVRRDGSIDSTYPHFALVHYQFLALRAMFAAGTILNRAVVLPEFWCGFDRWWAPHKGIIPGSSFKTPFKCPADHVLELEVMSKVDWPESEYGPHIEWKEYSFLDNERAKKPVLQRRLVVHTCGEDITAPQPPDGIGCNDGTEPAEIEVGGVMWLQPGMNEEQLRMAFSGPDINRYTLIHFEDAAALWKGFKDESLAKKFKKRLDMYTSIWCCVDKPVGHIWYDFFWDVGAHKDKHGREIGPRWEPQTGP